jgi:TolB protein
MARRSLSSLWGMLLVAVVVFSLAMPARATFPGKNGRIAFVGGNLGPNGGDIFTMESDGGDVKQLTTFADNGGAACCGSWSPDGRQLVFAAFPAGASTYQLWMMNADGSNQRQLLNDPNGFDLSPNFSPDGSQIVFNRFSAVFQGAIYRIRADGTGLTALVDFDPNPDSSAFDPIYSPDGLTIAFDSVDRSGLIYAVYVMGTDGSHIHPLSPPWLEAWTPDWSPDGKKMIFSTRALYPQNTLTPQGWMMSNDADDAELEQITFPGKSRDLGPVWSPQGDAIAFERDSPDGSTFAIYVTNPDGSGERPVFQRPRSGGAAPLSSPIGRLLARGKDKPDLRLIQTGGAAPRWGPAPQ